MARRPRPCLAHAILSPFSCAQYRPQPRKIFHTEKQLAPSTSKIFITKVLYFSPDPYYNQAITGRLLRHFKMDIRKKIQEAVKGFENLSEEECIEITLSAKSLSLEECYDSLLIVPTDLSAEETKFAEQLHKYGRAIGVKDATESLFYHMKTKNGADSSLEYLRQMGGEFSVDVVPGGGNKGFSFNVNIGEKK